MLRLEAGDELIDRRIGIVAVNRAHGVVEEVGQVRDRVGPVISVHVLGRDHWNVDAGGADLTKRARSGRCERGQQQDVRRLRQRFEPRDLRRDVGVVHHEHVGAENAVGPLSSLKRASKAALTDLSY